MPGRPARFLILISKNGLSTANVNPEEKVKGLHPARVPPGKTVPRYSEWNKLMAKARNPKGPVQRLRPQLRLVALTWARLSEADPSSVARRPRSLSAQALLRRVDRLGFRVSAFGFPSCPIPLKTANIRN